MLRRPLLVLTLIATALVLPAAASAVVVTPDAGGTFEVAVAPDPGGGALLAWIATTSRGQALRIRERGADGRYGPVQELLQAQVLVTPSVAVGPGGSALVLVGRSAGSAAFPSEIVAVRRAGRGQPFASPEVVARADGYASVLSVAANRAGNVVAVTQADREGAVVSTHTGLATATLTPLGPVGTAGAAIGEGGRVVVATYADGQRDIVVRSWQTGGPVGEARMLTRLRSRPDLRAAVDGQGTATVAFARDLPGNEIGVVAARSPAGQPFGGPVVLDRGPNAQIADVTAGGTKTVVAWSALTSRRETVRVAFARGAGGFDGVQAPGTPTLRLRGTAGRVPSSANRPRAAVSPSGDVVVAYGYGPFQAVHTTLRRAGAARFAARADGARARRPAHPGVHRRPNAVRGDRRRHRDHRGERVDRAKPPPPSPRAVHDAVVGAGAALARHRDDPRTLLDPLRRAGQRADHDGHRPSPWPERATHLETGAPRRRADSRGSSSAGDVHATRRGPGGVRAHRSRQREGDRDGGQRLWCGAVFA